MAKDTESKELKDADKKAVQNVVTTDKTQNVIPTIIKSGIKNVLAKIKYKDANGTITERKIEPYEIKNGMLYGFSSEKNSIRAFKTNNIIEATMTRTKFVPRWPIKL